MGEKINTLTTLVMLHTVTHTLLNTLKQVQCTNQTSYSLASLTSQPTFPHLLLKQAEYILNVCIRTGLTQIEFDSQACDLIQFRSQFDTDSFGYTQYQAQYMSVFLT